MFRTGLRFVRSNALVRNSLTLMSGGVASQVVVFLFSPVLSRVFAPADFADLANFGAWTAVLALLSNLRYEHAVLVTDDDDETDGVMALCLALSLTSTAILGLVAFALVGQNPTSGYLADLRRVAPLVPFGVLLASVFSLLVQQQIRVGSFRSVTTAVALQVVATVLLQLGFGLLDVRHALVLGAIGGYLPATALTVRAYLRHRPLDGITSRVDATSLKRLARRHANFPRFALAADGVALLSQRFLPVLVLAWFGATTAGLYAFSVRAVRLPVLMVAQPVVGALRKEAADRVRDGGEGLLRLFAKTTLSLGVLGLVPFGLLMMVGEELFEFVFGPQWLEAGTMVEILCPGIMAEFASVPASVFFLVTGTQHRALIGQAVGFGAMVAALAASGGGDFLHACRLLAVAMIAASALTVFLAALSCRDALHGRPRTGDVVRATRSPES